MKSKTYNILYAILIYCTSFVLTPQSYVYPIILLLGLWQFLKSINYSLKKEDLLLLIGFLISVLVFIFGYKYAINEDSKSILNTYVPYTLLIVSIVFFSRNLNREIIYYLFFLLLFEIGVGIIEFVLGIPYIFVPNAGIGETEYGSTGLLYFNRVFGLSSAVSVFAQKVLISLVLLHYLDFSIKFRRIILVFLIVGFLVSFNRTAIVSGAVFILFYYFRKINLKRITIGIIGLIALVSLALANLEIIIEQFFRGKTEIDYSGRDNIFDFFSNFIKENPLWGNYIQKLWYKPTANELYHAHNTYLETVASTGIVVSFFLFSFIFFTAKRRKTFLYISPFLIYSMSQFGFFWGISLLDIIFFYLLQVGVKNQSNSHLNLRKQI
ncbi:O-antigen ligase family protein [Sphingobacterium daejeonense]|uniref:O-antigen ligase family protein n=1 Tax=Sphingobacterium daejeonense TaxID=371142 RepID=UPI0021A419AE|nr:O-antigen ligase family protein [Sphingobacterium daejeonense]MCT1532636.1 O-antigen ligase family protein [Sphingobacterium daejeonense]